MFMTLKYTGGTIPATIGWAHQTGARTWKMYGVHEMASYGRTTQVR